MNTFNRFAIRSAAALALAATLTVSPLATAAAPSGHANPLAPAAAANPYDDAPAADGHAAPSHGGDAHGGHSGHVEVDPGDHETPELISPKLSEMIWTLVVFGIFFAVLATVVWPKILAALQAREDKQRNDLKTAEDAAKKATASIAEYDAKLAEARKEAQGIVAEARTAAQQAANADKAKIEAEVATMKAAAKADIAAAKEQALTDIYAQTATLSTAVAGKILQREINADDQQQLINDSLAQFKSTQN